MLQQQWETDAPREPRPQRLVTQLGIHGGWERGDFYSGTLEDKNTIYHNSQAKFDVEQSESWGENSRSTIERKEPGLFQMKLMEAISKAPFLNFAHLLLCLPLGGRISQNALHYFGGHLRMNQ